MPKLQQTKNGQYTVTIPRNIAVALGWQKGEELKLSFSRKGALELSKE